MADRKDNDSNAPAKSTHQDELDVSIQFENTDILDISHEFIRKYIRHIDQKASILLTVLLAILGVFANGLRAGQFVLVPWEIFWGGIAALFAVLSLTLATWAVYPKANKPSVDADPSYIYWENIRLFSDADEMIEDIENLSPEEALQQMSSDLYVIADIARNKYDNLRRAMVLTFLSAFFATPALVYRFLKEASQFTTISEGSVILQYPRIVSAAVTFSLWFIILFTIIGSERVNRIQWINDLKNRFS
jgi:hypothetical protein